MAIFGAQGIRDSVKKAYRKHREAYRTKSPAEEFSEHHAALHGALVLRYAAAYRAVPEALVWLELIPFLPLEEEEAVEAVAEYVVYQERGRDADLDGLRSSVRRGLAGLSREDRKEFTAAAENYRFAWRRLL